MKPPRSAMSVFLAALLAGVPLATAADSNLEFNGGTQGWQTVLDGVMGGLSTGRIRAGDGGTMQFSGELSLENNGGFSQIRTAVTEGQFAGAKAMLLRVKGDGRTYQCDLRSSQLRLMAGGYQRTFATVAGEWSEIELPLGEFVANSFGRRVRNAPVLDPATIESVGITLADKKEGPFAIEIDWIRPTGQTSAGASAKSPAAAAAVSAAAKADMSATAAPDRARRAAVILELAIERGVPRFNAGDQASCAALYELAITSVLLLGGDTLGESASAELASALKQGMNQQDASERAWTYRRAMDRALGQMAERMKSEE